MFKVTRELIKARQLYSYYELELVSVQQLGTGVANQCFQNATDDALLLAGNKVVSGWVVFPFDVKHQSTAVVQHWWNIDSAGQFFDLTPGVPSDVEYIVDQDIIEYGNKHYEALTNMVASSLEYRNGVFYRIVNTNSSLLSVPIPNLSTENLFTV